MNFILFFGIIIILQMMYNDVGGACLVTFTKDQLHKRQPIFLINRGKEYNFVIFRRERDMIQTTIASDKHLKVACAGLTYDKVETKEVKVLREMYTVYCINNGILIYNNEGKYIGNNPSSISNCYNMSTPYTAVTKDSCGGNGKIVKVGFYVSLLQTVISGKIQRKFINEGFIRDPLHPVNLANVQDTTIVTNKHLFGITEYYQEPPEKKFLPPTLIKAYEACVVTSKKKVFYTFHKIYGPALNIGKAADAETFDYYKNYSKLESQNELSEYEGLMKGIHNIMTFARTHRSTPMEKSRHQILKQFVPPIEMPSYVFSLNTFFLLNTFTLWNHVESNWLNVENQIRRLATMRNISLEIYTGKVENPNFLWKIVQFKYTKDYKDKNSYAYKGIAFVTDNSKDANHKPYNFVCANHRRQVCKDYKWAVSTKLTELGDTCCYSVHDLLKAEIFPVKIEAVEKILEKGNYSDLSFKEEEQILENIKKIQGGKEDTESEGEKNETAFELGTVSKKGKEKEEDTEAEIK